MADAPGRPSGGPAVSAPTVGIEPSGNPAVDGLLTGDAWDVGILSYGDPAHPRLYGSGYPVDDDRDGLSTPLDGFAPLSARQRIIAQAVLDTAAHGQPAGYAGFSLEGFTLLELVYAGRRADDAVIRLANTTDARGPNGTAFALFPSPAPEGGDVWFENEGDRPEAGNGDAMTVLHELGHALGLKHGHEAGAFGRMPRALDSIEFTVMSYRSFVGAPTEGRYTHEFWGSPQSFMMYDIAALQHLYGADFTTRADPTVYAWTPRSGETFVNGEVAVPAGENRVFLTIWDGGGRDTYDFSAYASDVRVSLRPGAWSVISVEQLTDLGGGPGLARGNVFNALQYRGDARSLIENAVGGEGDDRLAGNAAHNRLFGGHGDDRLAGGRGEDALTGGRGADLLKGGPDADRFEFLRLADSEPGDGMDVIFGEDGAVAVEGAGVAGGDLIDLARIDADVATRRDDAFDFGGNGRGCVSLADRGGSTLVRCNVDDNAGFELAFLIDDGAVRADAYRAEDFVL